MAKVIENIHQPRTARMTIVASRGTQISICDSCKASKGTLEALHVYWHTGRVGSSLSSSLYLFLNHHLTTDHIFSVIISMMNTAIQVDLILSDSVFTTEHFIASRNLIDQLVKQLFAEN